jgi:hypothetical protein
MPLSERVSDCPPPNGVSIAFQVRIRSPQSDRGPSLPSIGASFYDRIQALRGAPSLDSPCEPSLAMLRSLEGRGRMLAAIGGIGIVGVVIIVIIVIILFARR